MNRSVQGDVVVVEVFDEKEWKAPADEVVDQEVTLKNDDVEDPDDEGEGEDAEAILRERRALKSEESTRASAEKQPTGRVVGVIKRNWRA